MSKVHSSEHYNVTDLEKHRYANTPPEGRTAYATEYRDELIAQRETSQSPEWRLAEAISKFYLERLRTIGAARCASGVWFQMSWTHQILFYRLLLSHAGVIIQDGVGLGVSRKECLAYMKSVRNESYNTLQGILTEGIELGHIQQTEWFADKRNKIIFLTPTSVKDFMVHGLESVIRSAASSDLMFWLETVETYKETDPPTIKEQFEAIADRLAKEAEDV